jgi:hypothetical protein
MGCAAVPLDVYPRRLASTPRQTREDSRSGAAGGMIRKIRHRNSEMLN